MREIIDNYSNRMLWLGRQAHVRVRLDVDATGMPIGCHIQNAFNNEHFEEEACETLLKKARFEPALDAAGEPIASYWGKVIIYTIH